MEWEGGVRDWESRCEASLYVFQFPLAAHIPSVRFRSAISERDHENASWGILITFRGIFVFKSLYISAEVWTGSPRPHWSAGQIDGCGGQVREGIDVETNLTDRARTCIHIATCAAACCISGWRLVGAIHTVIPWDGETRTWLQILRCEAGIYGGRYFQGRPIQAMKSIVFEEVIYADSNYCITSSPVSLIWNPDGSLWTRWRWPWASTVVRVVQKVTFFDCSSLQNPIWGSI